jgi:hypothetical protein
MKKRDDEIRLAGRKRHQWHPCSNGRDNILDKLTKRG